MRVGPKTVEQKQHWDAAYLPVSGASCVFLRRLDDLLRFTRTPVSSITYIWLVQEPGELPEAGDDLAADVAERPPLVLAFGVLEAERYNAGKVFPQRLGEVVTKPPRVDCRKLGYLGRNCWQLALCR